MPWFRENGQYSDVPLEQSFDYTNQHPQALQVNRFSDPSSGQTFSLGLDDSAPLANYPKAVQIPSSSDRDVMSGITNVPGTFLRALTQGTAQATADTLGGVRLMTGSGALGQAVNPLIQSAQQGIHSAANYLADPEQLAAAQNGPAWGLNKLVADATEAVPSLAGSAAAKAIGAFGGGIAGSAVPIVGTAAGAGAGAIGADLTYWGMNSGSQMIDKLEGAGVDQDTAISNAREYAAVSAPIMALQNEILKIGKPLMGMGGAIKKDLTGLTGQALTDAIASNQQADKNIVDVGFQKVARPLIDKALKFAPEGLRDVIEESTKGGISMGAIMGIQSAIDNYFLDKAGTEYQQKNPNYSLSYINSLKQNPLTTGLAAMPTGAILGGASRLIQGKPGVPTTPPGATPMPDVAQDMKQLGAAGIIPESRQLPAPMEGENWQRGGNIEPPSMPGLSPEERQPVNSQTRPPEMQGSGIVQPSAQDISQPPQGIGTGMPPAPPSIIPNWSGILLNKEQGPSTPVPEATEQEKAPYANTQRMQLANQAMIRGLPVETGHSADNLRNMLGFHDRLQKQADDATKLSLPDAFNAAVAHGSDEIQKLSDSGTPVTDTIISGVAKHFADSYSLPKDHAVDIEAGIRKQVGIPKEIVNPKESENAVQEQSATGLSGSKEASTGKEVREGNTQEGIQEPATAREVKEEVAPAPNQKIVSSKPQIIKEHAGLTVGQKAEFKRNSKAKGKNVVVKALDLENGVANIAHDGISEDVKLETLQPTKQKLIAQRQKDFLKGLSIPERNKAKADAKEFDKAINSSVELGERHQHLFNDSRGFSAKSEGIGENNIKLNLRDAALKDMGVEVVYPDELRNPVFLSQHLGQLKTYLNSLREEKEKGRQFEENSTEFDPSKFSKRTEDDPIPPKHTKAESDAIYSGAVDTVKKLFPHLNIVVAHNNDELQKLIPDTASSRSWNRHPTFRGMFNEGKISLLTDNHKDVDDVVQTILHEAIGHYGLAGVSDTKFDSVLGTLADHYKVDKSTPTWKIDAEEKFAEESQKYTPSNAPMWIRQIWAKIKQVLRQMGINIKFSDSDIKDLMDESYRFAHEGKIIGAESPSVRFRPDEEPGVNNIGERMVAASGQETQDKVHESNAKSEASRPSMDKPIGPENFQLFSKARLFDQLSRFERMTTSLKERLEKAKGSIEQNKALKENASFLVDQLQRFLKSVPRSQQGEFAMFDGLHKIINSTTSLQQQGQYRKALDFFDKKATGLMRAAMTESMETANKSKTVEPAHKDAINAILHTITNKQAKRRVMTTDGIDGGDLEGILGKLADNNPDLKEPIQEALQNGVLGKNLEDIERPELAQVSSLVDHIQQSGSRIYKMEQEANKQDLIEGKEDLLDSTAMQSEGAKDALKQIPAGFAVDAKGHLIGKGTPMETNRANAAYKKYVEAVRDAKEHPITEGYIATLQKRGIGATINKFFSDGMKVEFLLNKLDGFQEGVKSIGGEWYKQIYKPINDGDTKEKILKTNWKQTVESISKKHGYNPRELIDATAFMVKGAKLGKEELSKADIMALYAHMQNGHNAQSLFSEHGNGYSEADAKKIVDQFLTAKDKAYVTDMVKAISSSYDDIVKVCKEIGEEPPPKIEGWYMPMQKSAHTTAWGKASDIEAPTLSGSASKMFGLASGFRNERVESGVMPLRLDFIRALDDHMDKVNRFIALAKPVKDINAKLHDSNIRKVMIDRLGVDGFQQFEPWLKNVVQPNYESAGSNTAEKIVKFLRQRAVVSVLAFRATTALAQTTQAFQAIPMVGSKNLLHGFNQLASNPKEAYRYAFANSQALKDRTHQYSDKDWREISTVGTAKQLLGLFPNKIGGKAVPDSVLGAVEKGAYRYAQMEGKINEAGGWMLKTMDGMVCTATWFAAMKQAHDQMKAEGKDYTTNPAYEKQCLEYADSVIRRTQSSPDAKDLSQWQRGGEAMKSVMALQSFFNTTYNMLNRNWQMTREGRQGYFKYCNNWFWLVGANAVAMTAIESLVHGNPDNEDWKKRMASNAVTSYFVGRPGMNLAASWLAKGYQPKMLAGQGLMDIGAGLQAAPGEIADQGILSEKSTRKLSSGILALSGLPKQAADTLFGAYEDLTDKSIDSTDAIRRLITSQPSISARAGLLNKSMEGMSKEEKAEELEGNDEAQSVMEKNRDLMAEKRKQKQS